MRKKYQETKLSITYYETDDVCTASLGFAENDMGDIYDGGTENIGEVYGN